MATPPVCRSKGIGPDGDGRGSTVDQLPVETAHFWAEVRRLPRRQAQTLALFYLEDRSVTETAEILGCSESTAREHLMRGRRSWLSV